MIIISQLASTGRVVNLEVKYYHKYYHKYYPLL